MILAYTGSNIVWAIVFGAGLGGWLGYLYGRTHED